MMSSSSLNLKFGKDSAGLESRRSGRCGAGLWQWQWQLQFRILGLLQLCTFCSWPEVSARLVEAIGAAFWLHDCSFWSVDNFHPSISLSLQRQQVCLQRRNWCLTSCGLASGTYGTRPCLSPLPLTAASKVTISAALQIPIEYSTPTTF